MSKDQKHLAIVGGGFSGTMLAHHLVKTAKKPIVLHIIEPRATLGLGLAYSTQCPHHLLNVPAGGMSAFADEPDNFLRYAQSKDPRVTATTFVPRMTFGAYVGELWREATDGAEATVTIEHVRNRVDDITKDGLFYRLSLDNGGSISVDAVALALGNLSGKQPRWLGTFNGEPKSYLHDPWEKGAISAIAPDKEILIVGTGLTAVDKIVELRSQGHSAKIYAVSRHGLLPRPHVAAFVGRSKKAEYGSTKLIESFKKVRAQAEAACLSPTDGGEESWRLAFDGLRSQTQSWWQSLDLSDQRRFLRHLKTIYDVHRHRMAPEIAATVASHIAEGKLEIVAGRLVELKSTNDGQRVEVKIKQRNSADQRTVTVDRIINCTGPQSGIDAVESPLLRRLVDSGIAQRNALKSGLSVSARGQLLDQKDNPIPGIFAVGPLLQGKLLESIAVPELRGQAQTLAQVVNEYFDLQLV